MTDEKKKVLECLECLRCDIEDKDKKAVMDYTEFLDLARAEPKRALRNIFQLLYDLVQSSVIKKEDEYPDDPESIGYVEYDCSKIFVDGMDNPFFADRLFANRFVKQVKDFKHGSQQNSIHVYLGPAGSGKSTMLNNLLKRIEQYTKTKEGQMFEILWSLDSDLLCPDKKGLGKVEVPCPSHDNPILVLPIDRRIDILDKLLTKSDSEKKYEWLFNGVIYKIHESLYNIADEKENEWIFEGRACTICESLFEALCSKLESLENVLSMMMVRPYQFNRRTGEGISVFNPGDKSPKELYLGDKQIQDKLDQIFTPSAIKYIFSPLAKTNNGIYVLMDVKSKPPHNKERFLELHNIISDDVHKVNGLEERIRSIFFAVMNPEDKEDINKEGLESLQARIQENMNPYVLEVTAEAKICQAAHGHKINSYFLPHIMNNFIRVIIASRMNRECEPLKEWLGSSTLNEYRQKHLCDEYGLLLRMEIYGGVIPAWLSEEDKKKFTSQVRRNLIEEAKNEGNSGFSGRDSLKHFKELLNLYGLKNPGEAAPRLIKIEDVVDYFKNRIGREIRAKNFIPNNFLDSLIDWYDFTVLNEVKESLYYYNKEQIRENILNYLCAGSSEPDGRKIQCFYTGKEVDVTIEFFKQMALYITGKGTDDYGAIKIAQDVQKKYVETIARDRNQQITETELYKDLFASYLRNLKDKVLEQFLINDNFRGAVKSFGTQDFDSFDKKLKERVVFMINNLKKLGYNEVGTKEVCLYILDKAVYKKFS